MEIEAKNQILIMEQFMELTDVVKELIRENYETEDTHMTTRIAITDFAKKYSVLSETQEALAQVTKPKATIITG
ncbi:hypothetical protein AYI68_g4702 [Smittium mucronatum]|uniref:Uncharacterized protein n=1 Tax=Smittium mucronatum TaxID=133383 RepID=A0A1R0GWC8_9FUNG|nr:hypothetical protein AYI68_g4702 [Smittium mucronatum]